MSIAAALDLSSKGGYDAVQMRDVAIKGEVALGTIYRYFSSKDHLLAAVLVDWMIDLERRVGLRPPRGDRTVDRVVDILRRASRAMEKEPQLSAAVITALSSPDPAVAECQRDMTTVMARIQAQAFPAGLRPRDPGPDHPGARLHLVHLAAGLGERLGGCRRHR